MISTCTPDRISRRDFPVKSSLRLRISFSFSPLPAPLRKAGGESRRRAARAGASPLRDDVRKLLSRASPKENDHG